MTTTTTVAAAAAAGQGPRRGGGEAAAAVAPAMVYHPSGMVAPGLCRAHGGATCTDARGGGCGELVREPVLHDSSLVSVGVVSVLHDDSTLIVSGEHGGASDAPTTYRTQRDIHNKVVSMRYDEAQADVKSIDASHTLGGGVLVQVTGRVATQGGRILRATLCNLSSSRRKRMGSLC